MSEPKWLTEIAERAEKATEGPWEFGAHHDRESDEAYAMVTAEREKGKPESQFVVAIACGYHVAESTLNMTFVEHARTDVPNLVTHVRELRRALREILFSSAVADAREVSDFGPRPPRQGRATTARVADACEALLAREDIPKEVDR